MADKKITALTELATVPADDDLFIIVDKSDTIMSPAGTNKKMPASVVKGMMDAKFEFAETKETVNASTAKRLVVVTADESNNGDGSLYIHDGTSLIFLLTIPILE
jgi:hypothetical protein